jgi:hypothetical protein
MGWFRCPSSEALARTHALHFLRRRRRQNPRREAYAGACLLCLDAPLCPEDDEKVQVPSGYSTSRSFEIYAREAARRYPGLASKVRLRWVQRRLDAKAG